MTKKKNKCIICEEHKKMDKEIEIIFYSRIDHDCIYKEDKLGE